MSVPYWEQEVTMVYARTLAHQRSFGLVKYVHLSGQFRADTRVLLYKNGGAPAGSTSVPFPRGI